MPSILVELDFICNPDMENFMASDNGSTRLARAIYNGISRYRDSSSATAPSKGKGKRTNNADKPVKTTNDSSKTTSQADATVDNSTDIIYRIQFLVAPHPLPDGDKRLKGLKADYYIDGGSVKYTTGAYTSIKDATHDLPDIKSKFHDAFIIKTRGGKRIK